MGIFDFIGDFFSGSDPVAPTSTQVTTQQLSPQQQQILDPLVPIITKFGTKPLEQFPKTQIPGFTPTELTAQQQAITAAGGIQQDVGQANVFANFLQGPALFPETNPALRSSIDAAIRPLTESFGESILPNIRGAEVVAGQVGGSRGRLAEQTAIRTLLRQIGETSSGIVNENFQNALRTGAQSLFAQPNLATSSLLPSQVLAGVGGAERGLDIARLQEEAQKFGAEQLREFAPAQAAANVAFAIPGGTTTSTSTITSGVGENSGFQNALGAASQTFGATGSVEAAAFAAIASVLFG